jgi:hypothetical protein
MASSGRPASRRPSTQARMDGRAECAALSEPPRRITALPAFSAQRAGIRGHVGRLSKMMPMTPSGVRTRWNAQAVRPRPSAIGRRRDRASAAMVIEARAMLRRACRIELQAVDEGVQRNALVARCRARRSALAARMSSARIAQRSRHGVSAACAFFSPIGVSARRAARGRARRPISSADRRSSSGAHALSTRSNQIIGVHQRRASIVAERFAAIRRCS